MNGPHEGVLPTQMAAPHCHVTLRLACCPCRAGVHTRRPHATRTGWAQRRAHVVEIEVHFTVFTAGPASVATTRSAAQPKYTTTMSHPPPLWARDLPVAMHRAACAREPARRYSQISAPSREHLPQRERGLWRMLAMLSASAPRLGPAAPSRPPCVLLAVALAHKGPASTRRQTLPSALRERPAHARR